jgi:poly(hydroxyalkanoate) granule-associated protein
MAVKKKGKLGSAGKASSAARESQGETHRQGNLLYTANQVWAAGLGALARAQGGSSKVFEDLVREGSRLQGTAIDTAQRVVMQAFQGAQKNVNRRVGSVRNQATETLDNLEKIFQTRVQRALHQLGMPTAEEITALTRKVDDLHHSVERLAQAERKARAKPAKKTSSRSRRRKGGGEKPPPEIVPPGGP